MSGPIARLVAPCQTGAMADITIRRARAGDAAALRRVIHAAYAGVARRIPDLPDVSEGIEDEIAHHHVFLAESKGIIHGGLVLDLSDTATLVNVAVAPEMSGQGLGRRFVALAESEARDAGHATIQLTTHQDMPENIRLYEHLGWDEVAREGNKVRMEKALG